ncbi:MAG: SDR family oxidoreductase [Burkholderiales bacterium]|nr:SDR family oxidoreductase [Burkholderiales bacterium]
MKDFQGKVAVITGGASGLGRAMAGRFAREGMCIVLADVEPDALAKAEKEMKAAGAKVIGVRTDVSKAAEVEALAQKTLAAFGAVHLLANNAGVAPLGNAWENSVADWEWIMGVNLWGVIHGVRVFTPIMLAQNSEAHIVNTASVSGLLSPPGSAMYNVTKHAVVTLTETLYHDLALKQARIGCSVLCPAYVPSGIVDSERNRPATLQNPAEEKTVEQQAREALLRKAVTSGKISADDVAQKVYEAVRDERFYILTHPRIKPSIQWRMEDILQERNPTNPMG